MRTVRHDVGAHQQQGQAPACIRVEVVRGEHGVSPGQACVFYDTAEGQARVLGGGFIKSAVGMVDVPQVANKARASVA